MFDIHQSICNKQGEIDERRQGKYIDGLMEEFAKSPEAQPVIDEHSGISWAAMMMEYFFGYIDGRLPEMTLGDFNEVVFELFPRKVSIEAESATEIIAELRGFWSFVQRQYGLKNARKILDSLTEDAERRLRGALSNPANFGMAKSFFMMGKAAGYDMTTEEGINEWVQAYNRSLMKAQRMPPPMVDFADEALEDYGEDDSEPEPKPGLVLPTRPPEERKKQRKKLRARWETQKRKRKK